MGKIDASIVRQARQTDLSSFLIQKGEPIKKVGRRFTHKEHDSLIISGNMFYWNSQQKKGNSLDFVMLFYGWEFEKAVFELTGSDVQKIERKPELNIPSKSLHIVPGNNIKRVIAYLCQTRKISYSIVKWLIENHYLLQDERGNAVFKVYDEKGVLVAAEAVGTLSTVRFKSFYEGSMLGYGFNVTIGEPLTTRYFESPIDLLSYWTLNEGQLNNCRLISLAGVREDIFDNSIVCFNIDFKTILLCVDRDQGGQAFINAIQGKCEGVGVDLPPAPYKDWNEFLKSK